MDEDISIVVSLEIETSVSCYEKISGGKLFHF